MYCTCRQSMVKRAPEICAWATQPRDAERWARLFVAVPMPAEPLAACRELVERVRALQVGQGKAARRAQAQADAVQADGIVAPQLLQHVPVPARAVEEIFSVDFEPVDPGPLLDELPVVRGAQAHPYAGHR